MEGFRQYLKKSLSLFGQKPLTTPLNLCMGNVSCDMDSVVGSMALSYYYNLKHETVFLPIINCKRDFFPMKLEIAQHLEYCKACDSESMLFQDDLLNLPLDSINEFALIDHNKLDNSQQYLESKITRIVDHHIDNNLYLEQLKEKEIKLIGSATTLVIDKLIKEYPELIDKDFAYFLMAPIVLDSFFFD